MQEWRIFILRTVVLQKSVFRSHHNETKLFVPIKASFARVYNYKHMWYLLMHMYTTMHSVGVLDLRSQRHLQEMDDRKCRKQSTNPQGIAAEIDNYL